MYYVLLQISQKVHYLWHLKILPDAVNFLLVFQIHVSINPGCNIDGCKLKNGTVGVTVANLTVLDDPSQHHEFHWVWSVIGHPVIQAAVTAKDSIAHVDWSAIFGMASAGKRPACT